MDITAAFLVYGYLGLRPIPLLKGIARGLIDTRADAGGLGTAALGLCLHFVIALSAAAVYYAISRKISFLLRHAVISGLLYGPAVYFFMQRIVLPLSAARRFPFSWEMMTIGVTIHICCVGLPIATMVKRYS
jgi:uncharacterized membrane protein YagU involved in acid resistance